MSVYVEKRDLSDLAPKKALDRMTVKVPAHSVVRFVLDCGLQRDLIGRVCGERERANQTTV